MADKKISALTGATTPLAGTEVLPIVQSGATVKVSAANVTAGRDTSFKTGLATPRNGAKPTNNSVVNGLTVFNDQDNVTGDGVSIFLDHSFGTPGTDTRGVKFSSSADTAYSGFVSAKVQVTNDGALVDSLIFRSSRDVAVSAGNLVIGTSGKGIDLSATPGTGTSELLADYEEGTFTPVVEGSTSAGTATYALQNGRYTKVGRQVYVEVAISWSGGTGTGNLTITGLPFTSANSGTVSGMSIAIADFVTLTALNIMTAFVPSNTTRIEAWQYPTGGGVANNVAYDAGAALYLSGSYTV
jgi:hypothetical protein